ncbi:MAG: RDD family protein [Cyclobacteriaceae bacterium]
MQSRFLSIKNILGVLFVACLCVMLVLAFQKYDNSIKWKVTSQAETEEIPGFSFSKGPFEFSIPGHKISIVESFAAGPIERTFDTERALLILAFIGLALLLAVATYLNGFWYYLILGLYIFFFISLDLGAVQFLGFSTFSKWGVAIVVAAFIGPAFLFNSYFKHTALGWRAISFIIIGLILAYFSKVNTILLQEQLAIGAYIGFAIVTVIFLVFIAEENIFGILYLITKAKGGRNNEKHFTAFTLVYLGVVGLAYARKAGWIDADIQFFDPFVLLAISSLVSLWSISHKAELYVNIMSKEHAQLFIMSLGIISFSFLGYNFFRGNDAYFESFHYLIIYMHLGFGVMFFLYIISNFINPLIEGFQIYRIAYKSRNLPYSTTRIGGMVAILAFFFLSDKEPLNLLRGGKYNLMGAKSEVSNEPKLATEYYRNGRVFAYDNHFSNYALGYQDLQKSKYSEANKRFGRAALRFPSAQSFVNESGTYSLMGETTPSLITLKKGLVEFPNETHLLNNLGLTYLDLNEADSARKYFGKAKSTSMLTDANKVNYWRSVNSNSIDQNTAKESFESGNTAVKANVLAKLLETGDTSFGLKFKAPDISFAMHELAYLNNAAFYFEEDTITALLKSALNKPLDINLYETVSHDLAILEIKRGNIIGAMHQLDILQAQANNAQKADIYNELGLIALSQYAPKLADSFFLTAISYDSKPARFNRIIAALEQSKWEEAETQTKELQQEDSSLTGFYNDLMQLNGGMTNTSSVLNVYYNYKKLTIDQLQSLVESMDKKFAKSLFDKIFRDSFFTNQATLNNYMKVFEQKIDLKEYKKILAGQIDQSEAQKGLKNPLNAPLFLASLKKFEDKEFVYNKLSEAIDLNPYSVPMIQTYTMSALDIGLKNYARNGFEKLKELMEPESFLIFEKAYELKIEELNTW